MALVGSGKCSRVRTNPLDRHIFKAKLLDLCLLGHPRVGKDQRHDENRAFPKLLVKPTPADKPTGHRRPVKLGPQNRFPVAYVSIR